MSKILHKALSSPVYNIIKKTPLEPAVKLGDITSNYIWFKREDMLPTFSFKLRGAYNKMCHLSTEQIKNGVVACSAGNHAQGVAYSAKKLGINATIVMPKVTPQIKLDAVKKLGSNIVIHGDNFDQSKRYAYEIMKKENRTLIHPYDDTDVIIGQATIGLELVQQIQQQNIHIDRIFCCVGGGGLISGVGSIIKELMPRIKIIGVEAEDQCAMTKSLKKGKRVELENVGTYADGTAVKLVGEKTFKICKKVVDEMVVVNNDEITNAIKQGFMDTRTIFEPSGALAIAGCQKYLADNYIMNNGNIIITSGANIDFNKLRYISNIQEETEGFISVSIPEKIGEFQNLYNRIYPREVTEFSYRYNSSIKHANILLGFKGTSKKDINKVIKNLNHNPNYNVIDLSSNQLAKDHFRYSTVINSNKIENEKLFRFHFPEYPGALSKFLNDLSNNFNVTLFNYKNQGGDIGRVLVGLQVCNEKKLQKFLHNLNFTYFEETNNEIYKQFLL